MNNNSSDKEFLDGVRDALDRNTASLDEDTLLQLRRIRLDALETAGQRRKFFAFPRLVTAGGLATAVIVAVAVSFWSTPPRQTLPVSHPEDVEVLVIKDHLDLYQDLDFYRWLSQAETKGKGR
jgi:hypothetical protein